ncbi:MAG: transposase [Patescibacteria group bacterium]
MARAHVFAPGEYYHLYSRGTEKRKIFLDRNDYERFIKILFFCNGTKPVVIRDLPVGLTFEKYIDKKGEMLIDIGAYCLMPNHFHLLVRERRDNGISLFMQKSITAYTMYFNEKYKRKGRLFESSYKSIHADDDNYLKYLFAYIHLNPVKLIDPDWKKSNIKDTEKFKKHLSKYVFSSFADYTGNSRDSALILNKKEFPQYFPTPDVFTTLIFDWFSTEV